MRKPINIRKHPTTRRRKGAVVVLAAFMMVVAVTLLALAVDVGYLCMARSQAQHCADAAALAAALEMSNNDNLQQDINARMQSAVQKALDCASQQDINRSVNTSNSPDGTTNVIESVSFGRLENPENPNEVVSYADPENPNVVQVRVLCEPGRGTGVPLFFSKIFGLDIGRTSADATAMFSMDNTTGFDKEEERPCTLMPFVVKEEDWNEFLANGGEDNWSYNPKTKEVTAGADGIPELKMYPSSEIGNSGMITPGNFGTVDIGENNNSAPDLQRQIVDGPSTEDLSHYDGILRLDPVTGTVELTGLANLELNGDPGITASIKHALSQIVGHPKTIMLYNDVVGVGDNTWFTISGFVGVRVVDYDMTGAAHKKYILIQPAMVQDSSAVTDSDSDTSDYVGQPIQLVR